MKQMKRALSDIVRFRSYTLRTKLIAAFLMVSLISVATVTFFTNRATTAALTEQVGSDLKNLANSNALATGNLLARQVDALQSLSLNRTLRDKINVANTEVYVGDPDVIQAKLEELDSQWRTAADTDLLIQLALQNTAATELNIFQDNKMKVGQFSTQEFPEIPKTKRADKPLKYSTSANRRERRKKAAIERRRKLG